LLAGHLDGERDRQAFVRLRQIPPDLDRIARGFRTGQDQAMFVFHGDLRLPGCGWRKATRGVLIILRNDGARCVQKMDEQFVRHVDRLAAFPAQRDREIALCLVDGKAS